MLNILFIDLLFGSFNSHIVIVKNLTVFNQMINEFNNHNLYPKKRKGKISKLSFLPIKIM
jgi:hypothetical protein